MKYLLKIELLSILACIIFSACKGQSNHLAERPEKTEQYREILMDTMVDNKRFQVSIDSLNDSIFFSCNGNTLGAEMIHSFSANSSRELGLFGIVHNTQKAEASLFYHDRQENMLFYSVSDQFEKTCLYLLFFSDNNPIIRFLL